MNYKSFLIGFVGAVSAALIIGAIVIIWHAWNDHTALHAIVGFLNANAAKIGKLP